MVHILPYPVESVTNDDIITLIRDAFQKRADEGIRFSLANFSIEGLLKLSHERSIYLAIDDEHGLCGTISILYATDNHNKKYSYMGLLAVSPKMQGQGIGDKLVKFIIQRSKEDKCNYIISTTAMNATSSVKLHKRNGFFIAGIQQFKRNNFYSYIFRKQLSCSFRKTKLFSVLSYVRAISLYEIRKRYM